ncbi:transcriptional repressor [Echinicola marina]|uniref:Transcriptional regulator n=1 Tax=Echinicola rosea TaxID=1807691 RepID=A0ABQ1VB94_9BACT|nr:MULTISPECIES: transcriptional repressor [Echinicola]UCS92238.1 transcriptional repressor [Echinicola marina]GGF44611.1 transcriptional regulator [Echinicola rosea]HNP16982.1 transcriptional repressor [Fulvivirga sp.]
MSAIKELEANLVMHKIKPTAMRLLVLEYLLDREAAVGLTELYRAFEKSDRTTLYRTLKVFEENRMVHSIDDGTGVPKYALCEDGCKCEIERDLHLHFHCSVCDETVCLTNHKIPKINLPEGYIAENSDFVVTGICKKCSGKKVLSC